jgi:hypothetical protein
MKRFWFLTVLGVVGATFALMSSPGLAQTVVTSVPYHNPGAPAATVCSTCPTCSVCQAVPVAMVPVPRMNCAVCPTCAGCNPAPAQVAGPDPAPQPKAASNNNPPASKPSSQPQPTQATPPAPPTAKCNICPTCAGCQAVVLPSPPPAAGTCTVYPYWNCAGDRDCDCIPDSVDKCPMDKENYNGIDDKDGCPDKIVPMVVIDKVVKDTDNDGIVDDDDRCPFEPEDRNGFMDEDGCPDGGKPTHYKEYMNKPLPPEKKVEESSSQDLNDEYLIHVGSFDDLIDAMNEAERLHDKLGIKRVCVSKAVVNGSTVYRTIAGPFKGMEPARKVLDVLLKVKWVKKPRVIPASKFKECLSMKF